MPSFGPTIGVCTSCKRIEPIYYLMLPNNDMICSRCWQKLFCNEEKEAEKMLKFAIDRIIKRENE